jgi:hypothetical protein
VKGRKRAPGGGRKPNPNKKVMFSTRLEPEVMAALRAGAQTWPGQNISTFAEYLINKGLRDRDEAERDPALRGLLLLIANLADEISAVRLESHKFLRSELRNRWRTDLFKFRAFKFAVKKLLDTLEEPPESSSMTAQEREKYAREAAEALGHNPEFTKLFVEIQKSPEALGASVFGNFWIRFTHSDLPFTDSERSIISKYPAMGRLMERENYDFHKARKALELKPEEEDLADAIRRIMKDRNLDFENEPVPPDIRKARDFIIDRGVSLHEAAATLPTAIERLKHIRSNPLPTLDEALKLLKSQKPKDKRR